MRSIKAIGYDMDYTLIHYDVTQWEQTAYEHLRGRLSELGFPVDDFQYDPDMMIRGLVIDKKLGNIVKPNRFGYVKQAYHGTGPLDFNLQRRIYSRTIVDIREDRWFLLTTLFDLPVACMYAQLVDKLDRKGLPQVIGYADLHEQVNSNLDIAYAEGLLRSEVLKDPERYVVEDVETPLTLLDQKHAGKKLLLITDSDWGYVKAIMAYTLDPHLPDGTTWRDLFDCDPTGSALAARLFLTAKRPDPSFLSHRGPTQRSRTQMVTWRGSGVFFGDTLSQVGKSPPEKDSRPRPDPPPVNAPRKTTSLPLAVR